MDCRTARLLLPYAARQAELGPEDLADLERHLAACSDCAATVRAERSFDTAVGRAMRAVPEPVGLNQRISDKLARDRRRTWRKPVLRWTAAAAALLLLVSSSLAWWGTRKKDVNPMVLASVIESYITDMAGPESERQLEDRLREQGLKVRYPRDVNFDLAMLAWYGVVDFEGHDVAKLDFQRGEARASMYILPKRHFRLQKDAPLRDDQSHCVVEVVDSDKDYLIVLVFQNGGTREHFQRTAVVG